MPPSKIFDMMYGSVFYAADEKMEVVLSGLYADIAAHDAHDKAVEARYWAIYYKVTDDAEAKTLGTSITKSINSQGIFSWCTGENDGSNKDELYTIFRIPGLSDEKVKEIAKKAGGQGIGGV